MDVELRIPTGFFAATASVPTFSLIQVVGIAIGTATEISAGYGDQVVVMNACGFQLK